MILISDTGRQVFRRLISLYFYAHFQKKGTVREPSRERFSGQTIIFALSGGIPLKKVVHEKTRIEKPFTCRVCGYPVNPEGGGTQHRNHCPHCLSSLHLDETPGDRASDCGGIMDPIGIWVRKGGEWAIIHRCRRCGHLSSNRTAGDDNPLLLVALAAKPLAEPPFPLYLTERMAESLGQTMPEEKLPEGKRPARRAHKNDE